MFIIPLCAFFRMRKDANADVDNEMDACNSSKMHPIMQLNFPEHKEQNTFPSSSTTGSSMLEELHLLLEKQQRGFHPSFFQMDSSNMYFKVKMKQNTLILQMHQCRKLPTKDHTIGLIGQRDKSILSSKNAYQRYQESRERYGAGNPLYDKKYDRHSHMQVCTCSHFKHQAQISHQNKTSTQLHYLYIS